MGFEEARDHSGRSVAPMRPARPVRVPRHLLSSKSSLQIPAALRSLFTVLLAVCAVGVSIAQAQPRLQRRGPTAPSESVVEYELDNGWRFLLYPRPGAPTLSFETYVSVGSADDPQGMSGMANLVKNLLFKGSQRIGSKDWQQESEALAKVSTAHRTWRDAVPAGSAQEISAAKLLFESARVQAAEFVNPEEFSRVLEGAGGSGTLNAFVSQNSTRFVVSLPTNQAELWCWMESERFLQPVFREFFVERAALVEEWNSRTAGDSAGVLAQALRAAAYGDHPLGRPSAGLGDEISALDPVAAIEFFDQHYGPSQMVTTIVGNMDPDSMLPLLKKYFGRLPTHTSQPPLLPALAEQQAERRVQVAAEGEPLLWIAWHVPPLAHPDSPAIEIAIRILGYARSSRLERRLTRTSSLASNLELSPNWEGDRRASLAVIRCTPTLETEYEELEQAIYSEIERLTEGGPTNEELTGVKRVATADHYRALRVNSACAAGLGASLAKTGLWRPYFERERRLDAVQAREVQAVLAKWFVKKKRTVATLVPPKPIATPVAPSEEADSKPEAPGPTDAPEKSER